MRKLTPLRIAVFFFIFSLCWIYFSDIAVSRFTKDQELYTTLSIAKGWLYMLLSSVFLYSFISLYGKQKDRAEAELRDRESKLKSITDNVPDTIILADRAGHIEFVSQLLPGLTREKLLSSSVFDLVPPEQHATVEKALSFVFENGGVSQYESMGPGPNGTWRHYDIKVAPILVGNRAVSAVFVSRDITERKLTEEALRESQDQFRRVVENSPLSMALVNADGVIEYINHKAIDTFGYLPQDIPNMERWWVQAYPDEIYREKVIALWMGLVGEARLHNREIEQREYRVTCKDRSVKIVAIFGVWIADKVLVVFDDITEKHLLEDEQLKTQKLESIGTLAGGIAHDFNNLLQGVFGYISMAKLTHDNKEKSLAMLDQAEEALHMSVNLTTQLLTFSKGGKPVKKLIKIEPVIENAVKFALSGSHTDYRLDIAADLSAVEADSGQLAQVIQNIVLNANEAMAGRGTVTISAHNVDIPAKTNPRMLKGGQFVRIDIQDTGTGISAKDISKIFDPYFTTKQKGSGLGLATSYSIIKNHGGVIEVSSQLNTGTTFSIYLPASRNRVAESAITASAIASAKRGRVLLMDDEDFVRNVAKEMISAFGHQVEEAGDGKKAIELFIQAREAGNPFDLVILDLTVKGGMGGQETIAKLREIDPNIKAVVSSGYADSPVMADYPAYGFSAVLNKPYRIDSLKNCLNMFFS